MMQTLTKTEVAWVYAALESEHARLAQLIRDAERAGNGFGVYAATLRRDGLREVMHKLHTSLNNNDKRIAIK